jgi:DNA-binding XRE family transcriptional regulator
MLQQHPPITNATFRMSRLKVKNFPLEFLWASCLNMTQPDPSPYTKAERLFLVRIGRRIAELRAEKKFTQRTLAEAAGLHRNYIGFIETGRRNVHLLSLKKIADALEVPVHELFVLGSPRDDV